MTLVQFYVQDFVRLDLSVLSILFVNDYVKIRKFLYLYFFQIKILFSRFCLYSFFDLHTRVFCNYAIYLVGGL